MRLSRNRHWPVSHISMLCDSYVSQSFIHNRLGLSLNELNIDTDRPTISESLCINLFIRTAVFLLKFRTVMVPAKTKPYHVLLIILLIIDSLVTLEQLK